MSDYVRKKVVRFKIPDFIVAEIEKEIEAKDLYLSPQEILAEKYGLEAYAHKPNEFAVNNGYDFDKDKSNLFLDFMLDYEYGASGDFESVRLLTENEFEKYQKLFSKYFNIIDRNLLRLVEYSYYNGVDEPSVWNFEEV